MPTLFNPIHMNSQCPVFPENTHFAQIFVQKSLIIAQFFVQNCIFAEKKKYGCHFNENYGAAR